MKKAFGINKLKVFSIVTCAVVAAGSFTYVNNQTPRVKTLAATIEELEQEKEANDQKIDDLQSEIDALQSDIDEESEYQEKLQDKIDLQQQNIDSQTAVIDKLSEEIEDKEEKIISLKLDIAQKESDIDKNLELFKDRLKAMYVSGNDSLASALVGATDFYDMLSRIELISQVAKHDDELIDSLTLQLEQFQEAKIQLDTETEELTKDLETQQEYKDELKRAMEDYQKDYQQSADYIERQNKEIANRQSDIDDLEEQNEAYTAEQESIEEELQRTASTQSYEESYEEEESYSDEEDYSSDYVEEVPDSSADDSMGGSLSWPVPGFYGISSGYGYRWGTLHAGIDIAGGGIAGATITAADSGTVVLVKTGCSHNYGKDGSCGCNGGYGNYLAIDHGNGITTVYAHCDSVYVSVGQSVSRGEAVGSVGSTGYSTGFHCHFEVRVNGSTVDPTSYLY